MTVNEYLKNINAQLEDDVLSKNYGQYEVVEYSNSIKIKLPNGKIRVYNSYYPDKELFN